MNKKQMQCIKISTIQVTLINRFHNDNIILTKSTYTCN